VIGQNARPRQAELRSPRCITRGDTAPTAGAGHVQRAALTGLSTGAGLDIEVDADRPLDDVAVAAAPIDAATPDGVSKEPAVSRPRTRNQVAHVGHLEPVSTTVRNRRQMPGSA
jgi:hypothetical protein